MLNNVDFSVVCILIGLCLWGLFCLDFFFVVLLCFFLRSFKFINVRICYLWFFEFDKGVFEIRVLKYMKYFV